MAIALLEKALIEVVVEAVTRSVGSHSNSRYRKQVDSPRPQDTTRVRIVPRCLDAVQRVLGAVL